MARASPVPLRRLSPASWILLAACALACAPAGGPVPELLPVPAPDLAAADPAVREQLEDRLARLEALRASSSPEPTELAAAYGELGLSYILYDFLEAAEACFDNARALAPEDYRWTYLAGYLRQIQGRLPQALPLLEEALELEPRYLPAALRLGRARLELGELEAAEAHFRRALELEPEAAAAQEGLGRVAAARGDDAEAVEHFEAALALEPEASGIYYALGQSYRRLGDLEGARRALEQSGDVPARIPDPLINPLAVQAQSEQFFHMQGAEALEDRDYQTAAGAFGQALELNPRSFPAHRGLALALEKMGDLAGAAATLEQGLERGVADDPERDREERAESHRLLAGLAVLRGDDEEALDHYRRSLELAPDRPVLLLRYGNALARQGRFTEAVESYDRLLEVAPDFAPAVLEKRATALINLDRGEEAVADFRRAVAEAPRDPSLRLRFAAALEYLGESQEATRQRQMAAEMEGGAVGQARLAVERARLRVRQEDYEGAVEAYRQALDEAPGLVEARYGLAAVLGHLGHFDAAVEEYARVLETEPRHAAARRGQIAALVLSGRYGEARMALQGALRLFPRDARLALIQVRLLASAPEPRVRDGELALEIAERVFAEDQGPAVREALALALAAAGRHDEAARIQRELVPAGGGEGLQARRLAAFEARRAWSSATPQEILDGRAGGPG